MTAKYFYDAEPSWPEERSAPAGAPNVVIMVLDDVGYAQLGCFGSDEVEDEPDRERGQRQRQHDVTQEL